MKTCSTCKFKYFSDKNHTTFCDLFSNEDGETTTDVISICTLDWQFVPKLFIINDPNKFGCTLHEEKE